MIDYEDDFLTGEVKKAAKRKVRSWIFAIFCAALPIILIIFVVLTIGSGVFGAFSMVGGFLDSITGRSDTQTLIDSAAILDGLSEEEILEMVRNDRIDESFYETMMINKDEFMYLLESVIEYNSQDITRFIEIECEHTYLEWVEDIADPENTPSDEADNTDNEAEDVPSGHYIKRTEYVYKPMRVSSTDIEKFYLDWQLVYALCLTDTMSGVDSWTRSSGSAGTLGALEHYGPNHEEIDYIISNVRMNYEYITDLARSEKSSYTMQECQELVHTKFEYGDEDTTEGKWVYYYPRSVISRAYSGYSCMYYLLDETGQTLTNFITASDVGHFELIMKRFCRNYNFGYFSIILDFIPGAENLSERLKLYYQYKDEGYEIRDEEINYIIGSSIDVSALPTSTERLDTEFGDLTDYSDLIYDETTGSKIIAEAMTKVGCEYSQENRWGEGVYDCSSFIWRILQSVGIDLSSICSGSTAAEECRGMVNAGMVVSLNDIKPGDVIFYSDHVNGRYRNVTHVAFYAGDGKIVHAASKKSGVKVGNFYKTGLVCVCRPYKAETGGI